MKKHKIEELFTIGLIYSDVGLFSYLAQLDSFGEPVYPLVSTFINQNNYLLLDSDYFVGHSADKWFSPMMTKLVKTICDENNIYRY